MIWQPLIDELAQWREAGLTAHLWLRDDDAVEPTAKLDRLIGLTTHHEVPLVLAIVPAKTDARLATHIRPFVNVHPVVHGWSHANHAPPNEKKQELGHRGKSAVLDELSRGLARLRDLHGDRLLPVLVPPWNRIDRDLIGELPQFGFTGLSAFGHKPMPKPPGLTIANCHVDIIDWKDGARCRDHRQIVGDLTAELEHSRLSNRAPVGLLSHHLVSDDAAFGLLANLFAATKQLCRWIVPEGFRA